MVQEGPYSFDRDGKSEALPKRDLHVRDAHYFSSQAEQMPGLICVVV
jgi:hypothetical protein